MGKPDEEGSRSKSSTFLTHGRLFTEFSFTS